MSRFKLGVVGVLAAFVLPVVGGVGASTASAAFTLTPRLCSGTATINFCYETSGSTSLFELEGEEEFELLPADAHFKSTIPPLTVAILCMEGAEAQHLVGGSFVADGLVQDPTPLLTSYTVKGLFLNFLGCELLAPAPTKCTTSLTNRTEELAGTPLSDEVIDFKPAAGTVFIRIPIENNGTEVCPAAIRGLQRVTGEQEAKWLEILVDLVEHTLDTVARSGLKFGATEAAAELEWEVPVFPLALGDPWAIEET